VPCSNGVSDRVVNGTVIGCGIAFAEEITSTEASFDPSHSQSISSRSSDSRMKLLTIPPPAHALVVTVTCPKNMYFSKLIVGASPTALITNSAPLAP
jgi:hypothetical protein